MQRLLSVFLSVQLSVCAASSALCEARKLGVLVPLTGPAAEYGVSTMNAFRIALGEAPAGSVPKLVVEDKKYEGLAAVSGLNAEITSAVPQGCRNARPTRGTSDR